MSDIAVIVPVLGRPGNARPLADSLAGSTDRALLLFVCSPSDLAQIAACEATGAGVVTVNDDPGPGDYAAKILAGFNAVAHDLVLLGGDDLRFHAGWVEAVEAVAERFDVGVIGTNDMANPLVKAGKHSTHPVVRRCYIETLGGSIDEPGSVYHLGYDHQYVDVELVETAKARGCYAHAGDARVEHLHPFYNKQTKLDDTYRKAHAEGSKDRKLYESRKHLWANARVTV